MTWRDRYQKASFRGVPFKVKSTNTQVGRRTALHEYPERDEPWAEDLGRKARQFSIEALVLGADYDQQRDALIEALETRGPGLLIHPYYGRLLVSLANPARISESPADEGGIARFSLDFVESGENEQPSSRPDTQGEVEAAADKAGEAVADDFAGQFSVKDSPDFVMASALAGARDIIGAMDSVRKSMIPDFTIVSEFMAAAYGLRNGLDALIRTPADLANGVLGMFSALRGLATTPLSGVTALRQLFDYETTSHQVAYSTTATPSRIRQADNQVAMNQLVQRAAVIQAVRASSAVKFDSHNQATALRDELCERIDALIEARPPRRVANPEKAEQVYIALVGLRVAMVKDITTRGADLARIGYVTLPATLPALVAAYRVYGTATRDGDIITRNPVSVKHPGFVPGGVPLEVLRGSNRR